MGRDATKATGNEWFEARLDAANRDPRLLSREGAAEVMNMSVDSIRRTEQGEEKKMPVEKAVLMADTYGAPNLKYHYCKQCPIGKDMPISEDVIGLDRITVKLMNILQEDNIERFRKKMLSISEDGVITEDEVKEIKEIISYLENLSKIISEVLIFGEIQVDKTETEKDIPA